MLYSAIRRQLRLRPYIAVQTSDVLRGKARIRYRSYSTPSRDTRELLDILLRNHELDEDGAVDELRWIRAEWRSAGQKNGQGLEDLVERRGGGEPLQYVLGNTDFGPLTLKCRSPVLIPRPETALVFSRFATLLKESHQTRRKGLKILDLCTGSAPIPLLLSHILDNQLQEITGVDISPLALALAAENVQLYEHGPGGKVRLVYGDVFDDEFISKLGKADVITSNPPYIPLCNWKTLSDSVRGHEDPLALIGSYPLPPLHTGGVDRRVDDRTDNDGGDGLAFYRRFAEILPNMLKVDVEHRGPKIGLEIGEGQGEEVSLLLRRLGKLHKTEIWHDQYGQQRLVVGW